MTKINLNYINKPLLEFNRHNINSSLIKKVVNFFNVLEVKNKKNIIKNFTKQFHPFDGNKDYIRLDENNYVRKSNTEKIQSLSNNKNEFNYSDWARSHGNNQSNRFSYLNQINKSNLNNLEKVWEVSFPKMFDKDIQANPIVKNGIIFFPTNSGSLMAVNGKTGEVKWSIDGFSHYIAKRGLVISEDNLIYFADNKHLVSVTSENGSLNERFGNNGKAKLGASSAVAPIIYKNTIITVTFDKTIEVFDKESGKNLWNYSFQDPKNSTKVNEINYLNSGGNPWGGISFDNNRGLLFITTGNPSSYFDGSSRPGLNKYSNSIIAFDINIKKIIWDFQEIFHDIWNLDIPAPPILSTVTLKNNNKIDVVIAITKLGNTIILDRSTGEPIHDIFYKKAPSSKIFNEETSLFQINQKIPQPFSKSLFSKDEITTRDERNAKYVLEKINNKKFGFFETYELNKKNIQFNFHGGAEWPGASVDHKTGTMYVTSNEIAWITELQLVSKKKNKYVSKFERLKDLDGYPGSKPPWGKITALNLNNGKILWQKPFGNYSDLTFFDNGKIVDSGTENFGGVTGTNGGLLFATGTLDSKLYVFDSDNGKKLKEFKLPYIGSSPPTIYEVDGRQYILIVSTGSFSLNQGYPDIVSFGNKLIAFALK